MLPHNATLRVAPGLAAIEASVGLRVIQIVVDHAE